MKYFVGLDVSLQETAICIVDEEGTTSREDEVRMTAHNVLHTGLAW
jgi:hypothetical protein